MKNLMITIERIPLCSDFITSIKPKTSEVENEKRMSRRKPVLNKKYQQEYIEVPPKRDMKKFCEYIEESDLIDNKGPGIQKEKIQQNVKNTKNEKSEKKKKLESKTKKFQLKGQIKKNTPLLSRLRKFEDVNYFESSLEETPVKTSHINNGIKHKVPIYRQPFLVETKANHQDPYALDIDTETEKREKSKRKNSGKFDKTIYDILSNIEKKEKKAVRKKVVRKSPSKYDQNINKALNRVMMKVRAKKGVDESSVTENAPETVFEKSIIGHHSQEDFLGFNNNTGNNWSGNQSSKFSNVLQDNSQHSNLNTSPQNISVVTNNAEIEYHSTPNRKRSENCRINILSDITIGNNIDSSLIKTKLNTDFMEKSHNLCGAFHNSSHLLNNQSIISTNSYHTIQNCVQIYEDLGTVDHDTEFELDNDSDEDEFFGFKESMGTSPVNVNLGRKYDLRRLPWRFRGFCRRNPHILKIKKNGLPCNQQEMVLDHEFVKRIENLSANNINKKPEPAIPNPPVQTTMLNFIETRLEHAQDPPRRSLFDYEEFDVAKPPRKPLGEIQHNQIVSTPRKVIQSHLESPNLSVIQYNEDNENLVHRHYNRKALEKKRDDKQKEEHVDLSTSILNVKNDGVTDADRYLFEDIEGEKNIDYSIKLPTVHYGNQRKRTREEADNEKILKKKKKGMMTKTEEAEFEAWAAQTNARFEEEDRHELTIE